MKNNNSGKHPIKKEFPVPPSAHHNEPLPWQKLKPVEEDSDSPRRMQELLSSASYRRR